MSRRRISQREARRTKTALVELRKRVDQVLGYWSHDHVGTVVAEFSVEESKVHLVNLAHRLGFTVVVRVNSSNRMVCFAVKGSELIR